MELKEPSAKYLVRPGYRQTEVGVIPEDWNIARLDGLSGFVTKGATPTTYGFKWVADGILFLRSECVSERGLDLAQSMYISEDAHRCLLRSEVEQGDLLMTITGNVGRVVRLDGIEKGNINQHIARIRVVSDEADARYVYFALSRPEVRKRFDAITTGQAYPQIGLKQVREAEIALPPVREQQAIADALGDADALIESLEHLLAKQRLLRQATIQALLTGERRLPGFDGAWESRALGDLGRWVGGMTPSMSNPDYWEPPAIPWISSGDVKTSRLSSTGSAISQDAAHQYPSIVMPVGSIVVVMRSGILRNCLPVAMIMQRMAINQDLKAIIPSKEIIGDFLLHALRFNGDAILAKCLKSGTTVESIEFPWLKGFEIPLPPLPEQTAIATVLSDLDAEIAALEARIAKARLVKQGMMQELLTGRIRLV